MSEAPATLSWSRLIYEMGLKGLPAMLACHCEVVHYDHVGPALTLELQRELQPLMDSPAMDDLQRALYAKLGEGSSLNITLGPAANAPIRNATGRRIAQYVAAYESFMNEPFIQDVLKMGGAIRVETVEPVTSSSAPKGAQP